MRTAAALVVLVWACVCACVYAEEGVLSFTRVPPQQSGLTDKIEISTNEKPAGIKWPWMSPPVDINRDGHLDILWYGHHGGGAGIWLGKGDGTFTFDGHDYNKRWVFAARDPVWWDVNGDGFVDAVGTEHKPAGWLFLNDGTGHWKQTDVRMGLGMFVDADGDGHLDEYFTRKDFQSIEPRLRDWGGKVPAKVAFQPLWKPEDAVGWPEDVPRQGTGSGSFSYAHSVDLDGDDTNEMVLNFTIGLGSDRIRGWVIRRDPASKCGWKDVTAARGLPTGAGHWFFPEDLDVDGDLDLIDLRTGLWYVNDGKGSFQESPKRIFNPETRRRKAPWDGDGEFEMLDLTNDGYRDLVFSGEHTTASGVFLNLGDAKFVEPRDNPIPGSRRDGKFGDMDGDYDIDVLAANGKTGEMTLLRNDTTNAGLALRLVPKAPAEAALGSKVWVWRAGMLGEPKGLLHYRQWFMERFVTRRNVLVPLLHVGLGSVDAVDVRVRFPSGVVREVKGVKARTAVEVREN